MSSALDIADLIAARLATAPATGELATVLDITHLPVIVDRQKSIVSDIAKGVGKAGGTAITILWQGFSTVEKNTSRPRLAQRYTLTVWSKPVIAGEDLAADDVMQSIITRMWRWIPGGGHCFAAAEITRGGLIPDAKYLVYDCELSIPVSL